MEILFLFFILCIKLRFGASRLRTPGWLGGFIWYFTAWCPISQEWCCQLWLLEKRKFYCCLTCISTELRFCTSQLRTPRWMDGFIWHNRDDTCLSFQIVKKIFAFLFCFFLYCCFEVRCWWFLTYFAWIHLILCSIGTSFIVMILKYWFVFWKENCWCSDDFDSYYTLQHE